MKKTIISLSIALSAIAIGVTSASAQSAYSSEQIIQHFIKSAKLGEARAICIGTEEECKVKKNAPLESLDMKVTFEHNSDVLTPTAKETLTAFATAINDYRLEVARFTVEGHTDALGTDDYNMKLSERRANAVTNTLISLGVDAARIDAFGFGESKPSNSDPFDPNNRRVEARMILPKQ